MPEPKKKEKVKIVRPPKEKDIKGSKGSLNSRIEMNPPIDVNGESGQSIRLPEAIEMEELLELTDGDLSDIDLFTEEINEVLSVSQRLKRRMIIHRNKNKILIKRRRSMKRRATQRVTQRRARRMAINQMKKRYSHGQKNLSYSERARVEKIVRKRKPAVTRLQRKLVRQVRKIETRRLHNSVEFDSVDMLFETFNRMMNNIESTENAVQ